MNHIQGVSKGALQGPDLTPMDFFLWGFVKDQVFVPPLPANVVNSELELLPQLQK